MSQLPDFAGAKIRIFQVTLKERGNQPLELYRADGPSRLYPINRERIACRGKGGCLFVQAGHALQSNAITELSQ